MTELVETSRAVGATRSRIAKTTALAALLNRLQPDEVAPAVGFLVGQPRQGRVGIGGRTLTAAEQPAASEPSLSVHDLDAAIDAVASATGAGSGERRSRVLRDLLARATSDEQDFIVRVLLGEIRHGALDGQLLDALAAAAEVPAATVRRAYMLSGDLGETAVAALSGGAEALAAVGLEVLRPVRPMLAGTAKTVEAALAATGAASVEHKLDGARIQVHRDGAEVRVFTRSLAEVTPRLPEVVEIVRSLPAGRLVLDGESLALDQDARPRSFQKTMSRFGADAPREQLLRPYFFDCLHVDGEDLIDLPLSDRLAALARVAGDWRIPGTVTDDPTVATGVLEDALASGHEGVMVKSLTVPYAAGRRGKAWQKVKPVRTLDLVVIAAEWGHGRRRGWLSNLHLGALDPDGDYVDPGSFVMVGKTFKGLTDTVLTWQTEALQARQTREDGITVHVRPELVVEIALDGAQGSPRYPGGVALRFARVVRYRDDKSADEADTIAAVRALLPPG